MLDLKVKFSEIYYNRTGIPSCSIPITIYCKKGQLDMLFFLNGKWLLFEKFDENGNVFPLTKTIEYLDVKKEFDKKNLPLHKEIFFILNRSVGI